MQKQSLFNKYRVMIFMIYVKQKMNKAYWLIHVCSIRILPGTVRKYIWTHLFISIIICRQKKYFFKEDNGLQDWCKTYYHIQSTVYVYKIKENNGLFLIVCFLPSFNTFTSNAFHYLKVVVCLRWYTLNLFCMIIRINDNSFH